jgi:hypothetical protein
LQLIISMTMTIYNRWPLRFKYSLFIFIRLAYTKLLPSCLLNVSPAIIN